MPIKIKSWLLVFFFIISSINPGYCLDPVVSGRSADPASKLQIPNDLGRVTESFRGRTAATVYFIQDAHLNTTAQKSISRLIEYLNKNQGVRFVGTEGLEGDFSREEFIRLPFQKAKKEILGELLLAKKITGAEYAAYSGISDKRDLRFSGVDDKELYVRNIFAFTDSFGWRREYLENLKRLKTNLENLENVVSSPTLRDFDKRALELREQQNNYFGYLRFLVETAEQRRIALASYPLLNSLHTALHNREKEVHLTEPSRLFEEAERLYETLWRALSNSPEEKRLHEDLHTVEILKRFFGFEMLPDEFDLYRAHPERFRLDRIDQTAKGLAERYRLAYQPMKKPARAMEIRDAMRKLASFYDLARQRDQVLVENQLEHMRRSSVDKGILIAGGFHSRGIARQLRERGVSYHVLQPEVDLATGNAGEYQDRMLSAGRLFRDPHSSAVIPLSNLQPLVTSRLDNRKQVGRFWRDEIYGPLVRRVREDNRDPDNTIVQIARNGVAGEIPTGALLGSLVDSELELRRLNRHMAAEGIHKVEDPAFREASRTRAASLGEPKPVDVMLVYLTTHLHEGKIYEPLGIESIAGYLEKVYSRPEQGIRVNVKLLHSQKDPLGAIIRRIKEERPKIVGLSLWFDTIEMAKQIYDALEEMPEAERPKIVLGGILATYNRERLFYKFPRAIVAVREGEYTMEKLVAHVHDPEKTPLNQVPNILYLSDSPDPGDPAKIKRILTTTHQVLVNYTALGLPRRDFVEDCIASGNNVNLRASVGCSGHCLYCTQAELRLRPPAYLDKNGPRPQDPNTRLLDPIFEEIRDLSRRGARKINIVDDAFLRGNLDLLEAFAGRMLREKANWTLQDEKKKRGEIPQDAPEEGIYRDLMFYTTARIIDIYVDPKRARSEEERRQIERDNERRKQVWMNLRRAGFMTFNIGVESGSDSQLRRYGKGVTVEEIRLALEKLREYSDELKREMRGGLGWEIGVEAGFIPFDPNVTLEELSDNVAFLRESDLMHAISYPFQQMRLQEGTPLTEAHARDHPLSEPSYNPNWLTHDYFYQDFRVASVLYHVKQWEPSVYRFYYALKQLMRAMPTPDATPLEHGLFTALFREIQEIHIHFFQGMIDAEKGGLAHSLLPEEVRQRVFEEINRKRLRPYYFKFLHYLEKGRPDGIWTDAAIFKHLIYQSLVRNIITYEFLRGDVFSAQDILAELASSNQIYLDGQGIQVTIDREEVQRAIDQLIGKGELVPTTEQSPHLRTTNDFYALKGMLDVDKPKKGPPGTLHLSGFSQARTFNVALVAPLGSGKATVGRELKNKYGIPNIAVENLIRRWISLKMKSRYRYLKSHPPSKSSSAYEAHENLKGLYWEARENLRRTGVYFALPERVVQDMALDAFPGDPAKQKQFAQAIEHGDSLLPYEFIRDLLKEEMTERMRNDELSRGFVLEAGAYFDRLYRDVLGPLGVPLDYVVFIKPDKIIQERYLQAAAGENPETQAMLERYAGLEAGSLPVVHDFFSNLPRIVTLRVPLDRDRPDAARAVMESLDADYSYILTQGDARAYRRPEDRDIMIDLLTGDHSSVRRAFENYRSVYGAADHANAVIGNPAEHPKARVPDAVLQLALLEADRASDEEVIGWVKMMLGIEPLRLALKNSRLPGCKLLIERALAVSPSRETGQRSLAEVLGHRVEGDWPSPFVALRDHIYTPSRGPSERETRDRLIIDRLRNIPPGQATSPYEPYRGGLENEAVMMFKPGVVLPRTSQIEILRRLELFGFKVINVIRLTGPWMRQTNILDDQYEVTAVAAHRGRENFTPDDLKKLYEVYGTREGGRSVFQDIFEVPVEGADIYGAYELIEKFGLTPDEVTDLWKSGYDTPESPPGPKPLKGKVESPKPRAIVVDDDQASCTEIARQLEGLGFEVVRTASGRKALNLLASSRRGRFDIVFINPRTANINVRTFVREFGETDHPMIPFVLITEDELEGDRSSQDMHNEGQADVQILRKPISPAGILGIVSRLNGYEPPLNSERKPGSQRMRRATTPILPSEIRQRHLKGGKRKIFNRGYIDGINKIGDRLYVIPLKHPKVNGGRPFFMVNGHFIHYKQMYEGDGAETYAFIVRGQTPWPRMRKEFLGITNPADAPAGSIRHDLFTGALPMEGRRVDNTNNGVHFSESALEGLKEEMLWFPKLQLEDTALGSALLKNGYHKDEIAYFLGNPNVTLSGRRYFLFSLLSQKDADETVAFLLKHFPPFYFETPLAVAGDQARIVRPSLSLAGYHELAARYEQGRLSIAGARLKREELSPYPTDRSPDLDDISRMDPSVRRQRYREGVALMREGRVARILVSAGYAGRMMGYDRPEGERVRALVPLVRLPGSPEPLNAFEVQGWLQKTLSAQLLGGRQIPTLCMVNDLNARSVVERLKGIAGFGSGAADSVYLSIGMPRLNPTREDLEEKLGIGRAAEISRMLYLFGEGGVLKWEKSGVSRKTPGHIDAVAQLVLSRKLAELMRKGVEMIDIADASNLGTLPDPELYGIGRQLMDSKHIGMVPVVVPMKDDPGGGLVLVNGKPQIVESARLPKDYDFRSVPYLFSFRSLLRPEAILEFYGIDKNDYLDPKKISDEELVRRITRTHLEKLPVYVEIKEVPIPDEEQALRNLTKRYGAQFVQCYGDVAAHIPSHYLLVDREGGRTLSGFVAYKTKEDIARNEATAGRIIGRLSRLDPDRHPLEDSFTAQTTEGKSLGAQHQADLLDRVLENREALHTTVVLSSKDELLRLDGEILMRILKNPANHLTLYLPEELREAVPKKWLRINLHVASRETASLKEHLEKVSQTYSDSALVAPAAVLGASETAGYRGYRLVADRLMAGNQLVPNDAKRSTTEFLSVMSFGLILAKGRFTRDHGLETSLAYDAEMKTYCLNRDFVLGNLMERWLSAFRAIRELRKAA